MDTVAADCTVEIPAHTALSALVVAEVQPWARCSSCPATTAGDKRRDQCGGDGWYSENVGRDPDQIPLPRLMRREARCA